MIFTVIMLFISAFMHIYIWARMYVLVCQEITWLEASVFVVAAGPECRPPVLRRITALIFFVSIIGLFLHNTCLLLPRFLYSISSRGTGLVQGCSPHPLADNDWSIQQQCISSSLGYLIGLYAVFVLTVEGKIPSIWTFSGCQSH